MARLLWLPQVLRDAGLTVHEHSGWRTRGADSLGTIRGITCHATAGSRTSTDAGELHVLVNGSSTAPPPIAQLYLSRSGQWWVVASGKCNHNKTGWDGPNKGLGNSNLIGIEAQHSNTAAEPWPAVQYQSYVHGVAALVRKLGISVGRVAGHKEHQPYATRPPGEGSTKSDPTFNMVKFRADVAAVLAGGGDDMPMSEGERKQLITETWARDTDPDGNEVEPAWVALHGARTDARDAKAGVGALRTELAEVRKLVQQTTAPELDYDRLAEAMLRRIATTQG